MLRRSRSRFSRAPLRGSGRNDTLLVSRCKLVSADISFGGLWERVWEYHRCVPRYSIVVPFHNEEDNVTTLYDRLKAVMEQVGESFELVFVDDGSRDRTYRLLEEIAAVDSRVLVVKLRRNFGQTSALAAGFDHAS